MYEEEFEILDAQAQGKTYTMQDALKKIAEQIGLNPEEGFIEAEEREDGLFQVINTSFYLRRASIKEISQRTNIPPAYIRNTIDLLSDEEKAKIIL